MPRYMRINELYYTWLFCYLMLRNVLSNLFRLMNREKLANCFVDFQVTLLPDSLLSLGFHCSPVLTLPLLLSPPDRLFYLFFQFMTCASFCFTFCNQCWGADMNRAKQPRQDPLGEVVKPWANQTTRCTLLVWAKHNHRPSCVLHSGIQQSTIHMQSTQTVKCCPDEDNYI